MHPIMTKGCHRVSWIRAIRTKKSQTLLRPTVSESAVAARGRTGRWFPRSVGVTMHSSSCRADGIERWTGVADSVRPGRRVAARVEQRQQLETMIDHRSVGIGTQLGREYPNRRRVGTMLGRGVSGNEFWAVGGARRRASSSSSTSRPTVDSAVTSSRSATRPARLTTSRAAPRAAEPDVRLGVLEAIGVTRQRRLRPVVRPRSRLPDRRSGLRREPRPRRAGTYRALRAPPVIPW